MIQYLERTNDASNSMSEVIELSNLTGYSTLCCELMYRRGIRTADECIAFMNPSSEQLLDPFLFIDMDKAVDRIELALSRGEKICIFGDYDVDGICATSILLQYLQYRGADVFYHIPSRHTEGYGMSAYAVNLINEQGSTLIITVDNGITAIAEIELANSLGIDVIVTDHHKCFEGQLPDAYAVICHSRPDNTYPNTNICGAGIALKLVTALGGFCAAMPYIAYAGLATVADVVPLFGENRALVALAIAVMNSDEIPIGLLALLTICGLNGKPINERHFSFALAPRLNAAGRMAHASLSVDLMSAASMEEALELAQKLNELNETRRLEESKIMEDAITQISEKIDLVSSKLIVLRSTDWNPGIIGIAASRICEKYYRPAILFSEQNGILYGSARSTPDVNIYDVLVQFADMYVRFGGHSYAAGITMQAENFDSFAASADAFLADNSSPSDYIPKCYYDTEVDIGCITPELTRLLSKMAPFGTGNPCPMLLAKEVRFNSLNIIGTEQSHLRGRVYKNNTMLDIVAFDKASQFDSLMCADACDILFFPTENVWQGRSTVQLRIHEFKPCDIDTPETYFCNREAVFDDMLVNNLVHVCSNKADAPTGNVFKAANISDCITTDLKSGSMGTLILCFSPEGAADIYEKLDGLSVDLYTEKPVKRSCPYNTVIVAPNLAELEKNAPLMFKKVYLYDGAPSEKHLMAVARLAPQAAIILPDRALSFQNRILTDVASHINRETLTNLYSLFKTLTSAAPQYPAALFKYALSKLRMPLWVSKCALIIFYELGFFICDSNGRYYLNNNMHYRELTESQCYLSAAQGLELFDRVGEYIFSEISYYTCNEGECVL